LRRPACAEKQEESLYGAERAPELPVSTSLHEVFGPYHTSAAYGGAVIDLGVLLLDGASVRAATRVNIEQSLHPSEVGTRIDATRKPESAAPASFDGEDLTTAAPTKLSRPQ